MSIVAKRSPLSATAELLLTKAAFPKSIQLMTYSRYDGVFFGTRGDAEDTANHRTHDIATATDAVFGLHDRQSAHVLVDHRIVIASLADSLTDAARDRARRPITPLRQRALAACTHAHSHAQHTPPTEKPRPAPVKKQVSSMSQGSAATCSGCSASRSKRI